ncbi:hypothetical protein DFJ73DRAFT_813374 [Zopfochytrium polystomum]|nr:hypothetical protein DFJ73DRAFT_813374 [Zopfochytrium polystomum]
MDLDATLERMPAAAISNSTNATHSSNSSSSYVPPSSSSSSSSSTPSATTAAAGGSLPLQGYHRQITSPAFSNYGTASGGTLHENPFALHEGGPNALHSTSSSPAPYFDAHGSSSRPSQPGLIIPKDNWARMALLWSLLQLLGLLALESWVMHEHLNEYNDLVFLEEASDIDELNLIVGNARAITVYLALFMAAQLFQLYLSFDAIISSSVIQLIATSVFNLATLIYSVIAFYQSKLLTGKNVSQGLSDLFDQVGFVRHQAKYAQISVIGAGVLFFVGWLVLAIKLYHMFGWSIFKNMGADVQLRSRLYVYHIYMMLLKLDIFFLLGFTVQYISLAVIDTSPTVVYSNIFTLIPAAIILLVLAYFSVKKESKILMGCLVVGLLGGLGYLMSRLYDIYRNESNANRYKSSKTSLTLFITLTSILVVATIVVGVLAAMNFGKGLQEALRESKRRGSAQMQSLKEFVSPSY